MFGQTGGDEGIPDRFRVLGWGPVGPHPLAAGEWLHILGSVTAALQPVPGTVAETLPARLRALPG